MENDTFGGIPVATDSFGGQLADDAQPKRKRTLASIANDTVIEFVNAGAGGISAAANFIKPGNAFSGFIDKNLIEAGEANQSDVTKAAKQRFQQEVAGADGAMDELGAVGRYLVDNPLLSAAQAVGSFVGPGAAVKGGRTLASIAGLNAARGGLAGGAAAGAAMAGGDAAGTAHELATKAGATDEQAVAVGRQASVIPAVIGGVGGLVGAERLVAGAKGFAGNAASRALKTAGVEGAQEAIEEGVTQYEGQRAAMPYDKTIDPSKGVAAAAGMGAALGAATGGGVSLLTGGHAEPAPAPGAQPNPNELNAEPVAAPTQRPSEAMGINPDDGVMSRAAALAADMELAPVPPAPTAEQQRAQLDATISRLPEDQQREARVNLADADSEGLPAGVRAMRSARVQELADAAPAAEVDLAPEDMERGRVLQNFDARQPDLPTVEDYAPLIDEAIAPEHRAEYQDLLATATDMNRSRADRDAAAEVLHATFSPDQLQRARSVRPAPDTRLELQGTDPARFGNEIDFTEAPTTGPSPDPMAERIAQLALDTDITPGQPLQLNQAHALRRRAAEAGLPVSVVPHPGGRGYDVAPTARLDPAARAAMPQDEAAAQLPYDQRATGRMVASPGGGVRAETRPEAVALNNAATAQRLQVAAERQRRTELGLSNVTPVVPVTEAGNPALPRVAFDNAPTGRMVAGSDGVRQEGRAEVVNRANQLAPAPAPQTVASASGAPFASRQVAQQELQRQQLAGSHQVVPAGGDESLGFVLQEKGRNQAEATTTQAMNATESVADRAPSWRTNAMQANRVARELDIDTKGKRLAQVVAEIDARDAQSASAQQQRDDFRAAEVKRTAPGNRARAAAGDANPFKAFIAKHGIALDQRREFAPGATEQRQAMVPGYGPIFRKTGKPLDKLAQAAVDEGFLTSPDEAALYDLVGRALRGERIVAQYTADAAESEMQSRIARQREMEEDAASAVAVLSDPALFDLNDDDIVLNADSNASTEDFLRALGATDEEIQDAIANEQAGATAGDQGRARSQEADAGAAQGSAGQGTQEAQPESVTAGDLLGEAPNQSQQAAVDARARRQQQEVARRNEAPAPEGFALSMMDANTGREVAPGQTSIFAAQQQDRPPVPDPRQETDKNQAAAHAAQAQNAIKSGVNSGGADSRPAPRSTTRIEASGEARRDDGGASVLYSTTDQAPPAQGLSLEQAQQAVQQALAGLSNPPPIDIVVRSEEAWVDAPQGVMGAAIPEEGRIVLVASAHGSADAVVETLFHEMFHLGVHKVLPTPDYVQSMLDLAKRDSRVQRYATEWKSKAPDAPHQLRIMRERGYTGSELTARYEALAIEEGLAVVAEELRAQKQAGTRLGLRVRTLANWLASVAERMGMQGLAERIRRMTYNEAERFVLKAIEHAGLGPVSRDDAGGTRYRARDGNPRAQRMGDALKAVTVANLKQQAGFKAADYRGIGLQFLGRRQLVDVYGGMLPEMRRYSDLMARMDADKNEAGSGADQLAQDWAKLPDERALAELMHDATLAQIDPSKDFVEGDNKTDWTRLRAKHQALTPAAKEVYARARDTYRQHMRDVRSAIKERIERTEISSERKAAMLKRMDDEFFGHIKGVYFPLARFGQYVVVVKDAEGKVANVSRAETMAEADATRRQLVTAFPAGKGFAVGKVLKAKDFVAERDSVGRGFMEQLYGVLDKQGMDTKQRAELEDALGQLYLSSLPDLSWAKHGIHRKGTAGFSQDARRAFAQNVFHGASYLAKLRYGDRLQDELGEMQRRVDAGSTDSGFDSVKAQQVVDEMVKRHEAAMNPKTNAFSTWLTSLGFMFHLGLSPASAMVNLTQTALVAYPVMGAKWGFKKASAALLKASGEAARGKNDITGSLSADEKAAFDEAVRSGVIDVTMAHDLAGIAQGEDQNVSYKLRPAMRAASFLFHHAEKFNRQITFVAAYRLAREAGAGDKAAFDEAVQATYDGHFDYSSNNRPRVMQGNVARVVLLFKQYGQNMVYTLVRSAQQSLKGATPQERAQARKALGGLLVMHGLAAGALGLPMVTTLLAAASMLGGDDDEPWDAQVALQNLLADTFGQKPAEVLAHGLSRLTPWDISGRVGLDKLIFPDVQEGLEGQRLGESAMAAALGPVAGIGINVLKGIQEMSEGRYARGLEAMAPSVLRGPLKAWRYETEGVKDKSGIVVQDEVDAASLLGQAAGFSPSGVRNAYEGKSAIVQHDRALQARRSALVEQFAMAAMAGDEEGKAEAREAVAKFNEKNPNRRIQPMQLAQSVNMRQKRIREAQEGVYLPSKRRDAMEAGRFAAGE